MSRSGATVPPASGIPRGRVAIVAYFFPPLGGVAVARTLGFVRHLPAAGWEVTVVAPSENAYPLQDPAGLAAIPAGLDIHRAPSPEPGHLGHLLRRIRRAVRREAVSGWPRPAAVAPVRDVASSSEPAGSSAPGQARQTQDVTRRALRAVPSAVRRLAWFPDDQAGWTPFALLALLGAHGRSPVQAIVSSSSPVSGHLVALLASRVLGVPWVADFRDPWHDNPIDPVGAFTRWRRATLERTIIRLASACTFATPSLRATYARRYPRQASKFTLVPNGYESRVGTSEPIHHPRPADVDAPFHLVYAGSLYRPAELDAFLVGLRAFAGGPGAASRLCVTFVGTVTSPCAAVAARHLADPSIEGMVRFTGFVSREQAATAIAQADAALTLLGAGPGMDMFVGAKLFEYLAQDKQVFAVVPPGDARAILTELDWGVVADPEPVAIAEGLQRLMATPPPARRADPDRRYSRAASARRLAAVLDSVARHAEAGE